MARGRRGGRSKAGQDAPSEKTPQEEGSKTQATNHLEVMANTTTESDAHGSEPIRKDDEETPAGSLATATKKSSRTQSARKRQKREEYRASLRQEQELNGDKAELKIPKKKWFRQRAHTNPFSDHRLVYPVGPQQMDWSKHFPAFSRQPTASDDPRNALEDSPAEEANHELVKNVEIADIGCGFGGLLFALAPMYPDTLMLGMEIRTSVTEFVENKIRALRQQQLFSSDANPHEEEPQATTTTTDDSAETVARVAGGYQNISVVRANSMKFLPNFFPRASLKTIFFCFPDPHFKSRKHKARIVSSTLNSEYAYVLKEGGFVATITDVEELSQWMAAKFDKHDSFERIHVDDEAELSSSADSQDQVEARFLVKMMKESTEEGKKVDRFGGNKFVGIWKRLKDPDWPGEET